jgi:hypothetical protein
LRPLGSRRALHSHHERSVLERARKAADRRDRCRSEHGKRAGLGVISNTANDPTAPFVACIKRAAEIIVVVQERVRLVDQQGGRGGLDSAEQGGSRDIRGGERRTDDQTEHV